MKKIITLLFLLTFTFGLVACGKKPSQGNGEKTCAEDPTQEKCQIIGNKCTDDPYAEGCKIDLGGVQFLIYANDPNTADPRKDEYEGLMKEERVAAIAKAEEKYNIKVVYKGYTASWGDDRDTWIINDATAQTPTAHVYEISSSSIPTLAHSGAILPLDSYIEALGSHLYSDYTKQYFTVFGSIYAYTSNIPLNDNVIIYNNTMLKELGYDDEYPSKLWNNGEWTWDTFKTLVTELDAKMTKKTETNEPTYVLGGRSSNWAFNFIGANGGVYVDTNLKVQMENNSVTEAIEYLNKIYHIGGGPYLEYQDEAQVTVGNGNTWAMDSEYSDTLQTQFKNNKVVFHDGQTWYISSNSKLGKYVMGEDKLFEVGVVPYPIPESTYVEGGRCKDGSQTCSKEDLIYFTDDYANIGAWGAAGWVISSGWDKSDDPNFQKGYEFDDELVFRIWHDIQFGAVDEEYETYEEYEEAYIEEYVTNKYFNLYPQGGESISAHEDIIFAIRPDTLFAMGGEANSLAISSTVSSVELAIVGEESDVLSTLTYTANTLKGLVIQKFEIDQDGYTPEGDTTE